MSGQKRFAVDITGWRPFCGYIASLALDIPLMINYKEHCGISLIFDYAERTWLW